LYVFPTQAIAQSSTLFRSSYLGGSSFEQARDVAADSAGNFYITGGTRSADFPRTTGPAFNAGSCPSLGTGGKMDIFITKISPQGQIIWSRFLGGPCYDRAYAIEVDTQGNIYLAGRAGEGFPTTPGVVQPNFGGDITSNTVYGKQDGFIAKLSADGSQVQYASYFGGNDRSFFRDLAIDSQGVIHGVLTAVSLTNPHIPANAFQSSPQGQVDGIVVKFNATASQVAWATYLGGSGNDITTPSIRVDNQGNIYVSGASDSINIPVSTNAYQLQPKGGYDMYLAKFSSTGNFIFGTYIGGSQVEYGDTHNLALDPNQNPILGFTTKSNDFPMTANAYQKTYGGSGGSFNQTGDGVIVKIKSDGTQLIAASYLGGNSGEGLEGISVFSDGRIAVTGGAYSTNFPVTANSYQKLVAGNVDAYLSVFSSDLSQLLYSTLLGGTNIDRGLSNTIISNNLILIGETESTNFPVLNAADSTSNGGGDAFFTVFSLSTAASTPTPSVTFSTTPTPAPTTTPGDLDHDGDVDIFDYNLLVGKFGQTDCAVNITGSCVIDIFDYNLLVGNFGR